MNATKVKREVIGTADKRKRRFRVVGQDEIWFCTEESTDKALWQEEARKAKAQYRYELVCDKARELVFYIPMEYRDYIACCRWLSIEKSQVYSSYMCETIRFAGNWAKYMQWLMNRHNKDLESIVESSLKICKSISDECISDFKIKCAVNLLVPCWKYGDELQTWFTKKHGYDD